ncbi:MAG: hypothetical protein EDR02_06940 [Actinobacteria bacterium]|nr:MAG: hypothetical protein EDR02_06940 [Actinomycetota bacterium]RIK07308.1 MAG: hypothetical protein DCC48_04310 [Acidobacteriota bacterium]
MQSLVLREVVATSGAGTARAHRVISFQTARRAVTLLAFVVVVAACGGPSEPVRQDGGVVEGGELRPSALRVGDCITDQEPTPGYVEVVPCEESHVREVFLLSELEVDRYDRDEIDESARGICGDPEAVAGYAGGTADLAVFWYVPTEAEYDEGESFLVCALRSASDEPLTGSLHR